MFLFQKQNPSTKPSHQNNIVQSLSEHIASIEFDTSGNVISANPLFLNAVGYRLEELCSGCSGQLKLATVLEFSQYNRSDSLGVKPPLY
ncbi:hypothetical protein DYA89_17815 [Vibrio cholerae]|nr:hypothetical protein [Vibrio cholerae]GHZ78988.1 sensory box protein [Vibrio cholerae]